MKKHRVLIVEDDTHLLSGIKAILELGEYSVMTAQNGIEGLRVLGDQGDQLPDVIVSDITMPYMDGFRFLEEVRKQDDWVRIPFIFLTAHGEATNKRRGALAGADVYLTKPFNAQDLLLQVEARIERIEGIKHAAIRITDEQIVGIKNRILSTLEMGFRPQAVTAYAELFKEVGGQALPKEEVIPLLKEVNSGANHLRRLVENFITLVELDSGDAERTYEWRRRPVTNLRDLVMDAYQQITYPDDEPRTFECYIAPNLPEFTIDVQMITMAIRELLDNAAKFTPPDQPFLLRAQCVDDWLEIQVQDYGSGMPQNQIDHIWHAFYQSDRAHQEVGSGLALVHGIIQLHGGTHSIISDRHNGTTITIRLPLQTPESTPRISRTIGVNPMYPKYRVLVVEDDAHLLSGIKEILELEQYTVMTAHNGIEGLRVLQEEVDQPPDIIISDIAMPYMDGFRFLEEVRKRDDWVRIPFIFLTAHGERIDRHKGVQMGADDYLTKPFNAEDLIVSVKAKIDRIAKIDEASNRIATTQVVDVKRKILTILNHEFRTPLTLVVAYAELLKEFDPESMDENDVMTFLKGVNSGANRLRRLVENFITLVELDSADAEQNYLIRRRPITNLYDHVMDAFQQITYPDDQPRPFQCYVAEDIPEFVADSQMLTTAIRELLDNAAKFTPVDKSFTLRAQCVGDWVEIQVEDVGRGLPRSQYDSIWQPFYQFERDKFEHQGAGSGLAIVDGILKIHGGIRSVMSEEGKGSIFTIRLPLQPPMTLPRIGE